MAKSADAFRTISEVAEWLGVQTHVLRFWESKFTQIKPVKRAGGRRYYRPTDMLLLGGIRKLLHDDGLTIKGVQKLLREEGMAYVSDMSGPLDDEVSAQIEGDLVVDAEFVETELSPSSPDDTVTPFQPAPNAEPDTPEKTVFEPIQVEQELANTDEQPVAPHADEVPEDVSPAASLDPAPTPADNDSVAPPEPVFSRSPLSDPATEDPASVELPSFLAARTQETPQPDGALEAAAAASEPAKPKPRIVDVPDELDPDSVPVAPSALSMAGRVRRLTAAQRSTLRPLLAQLTALRDQMASAHRDPQ